MKTQVSISQNIKQWAPKFKNHLQQLYLFTAAQMQTNRGMLFINSGRYNGHETWPPLKLRQGQPLRDKGILMKSIGPLNRGKIPTYNQGTTIRISGDTVYVGTNLKYARLMNDGGTIVPKAGKVLWIPLPSGKSAQPHVSKATKGAKKGATLDGAPIVRLSNGKFYMLAKRVTIPPRPFDKLNDADKKEITKALVGEVARVLNA